MKLTNCAILFGILVLAIAVSIPLLQYVLKDTSNTDKTTRVGTTGDSKDIPKQLKDQITISSNKKIKSSFRHHSTTQQTTKLPKKRSKVTTKSDSAQETVKANTVESSDVDAIIHPTPSLKLKATKPKKSKSTRRVTESSGTSATSITATSSSAVVSTPPSTPLASLKKTVVNTEKHGAYRMVHSKHVNGKSNLPPLTNTIMSSQLTSNDGPPNLKSDTVSRVKPKSTISKSTYATPVTTSVHMRSSSFEKSSSRFVKGNVKVTHKYTSSPEPSATSPVIKPTVSTQRTSSISVASTTKSSITMHSKPSISKPSIVSSTKQSVSKPSTTNTANESTSKLLTVKSAKPSISKPSPVSSAKPSISKPSTTSSGKQSISTPSTVNSPKPSFSMSSTTSSAKESFSKPSTINSVKSSISKPSATSSAKQSISKSSSTTSDKSSIPKPSTASSTKLSISKPSTTSSGKQSISTPSTVNSPKPSISKPSTTSSAKESFSKPSTINSVKSSISKPSATSSAKQSISKSSSTTSDKSSIPKPSTASSTKPSISKPSTTSSGKQSISTPSTVNSPKPSISKPSTTSSAKESFSKPSTINSVKPSISKPSGSAKESFSKPSTVSSTKQSISKPSTTRTAKQSVSKTSTVNSAKPSISNPSATSSVKLSISKPSTAISDKLSTSKLSTTSSTKSPITDKVTSTPSINDKEIIGDKSKENEETLENNQSMKKRTNPSEPKHPKYPSSSSNKSDYIKDNISFHHITNEMQAINKINVEEHIGDVDSNALKFLHYQPVLKSSFDKNNYTYLKLNNSLQVLFISDSSTNTSTVALDISTGSFNSPKGYEGLAHFCEHMLTFSSQQYPNEDDFTSYVRENGGFYNAYTASEHTNFYFSVNSDHFKEALTKFAAFFVSLRLTDNAINQELKVVDDEHKQDLKSDVWRSWQLLKHISNPLHPFNSFSTGTLAKLNESGHLKEEMLKFYAQHYTANKMDLVVHSQEPIGTLSQLVSSLFSDVPQHMTESECNYTNVTSFPTSYNGKIIYYEPLSVKEHTLTLYWQVCSHLEKYREQVLPFLSHLIGNEGPGSILDHLQKQGWASSLIAGVELETITYSLFTVKIELTPKGLQNTSQVVTTNLQYIKMLGRLSELQWQPLWKDYTEIAKFKFNFNFKELKEDPIEYISTLSVRMKHVKDPENLLLSPDCFKFNHTLLTDTVSKLTSSNMLIFLGSKLLSNQTYLSSIQDINMSLPLPKSLTLKEPIHNTSYEVVNITNNLTDTWKRMGVPSLKLPSPNQYIPTNLHILPTPANPQNKPIKLIQSMQGTTVWWLHDTQFQEPKVYIYCDIQSDLVQQSFIKPRYTMYTQLLAMYLTNVLSTQTSTARSLGYSYTIIPTLRSLHVHLNGYSDMKAMTKFIETISEALKNTTTDIDQDLFIKAKTNLKDYYNNYNQTTPPYLYTVQYLQSYIMQRHFWSYWELMSELNISVSPATLRQHARYFLRVSPSLLCYVHGNIMGFMALEFIHSFSLALSNPQSTEPEGSYQRARLTVSPGNYSIVIPALNKEDNNSVVNIIYQIGPECVKRWQHNEEIKCSERSLNRSLLLGLFSMHMQHQCLEVFRKQQQLGRVVLCLQFVNEGIESFQILVQSIENSPVTILQQIDAFLLDYSSDFRRFTESALEFEKLKSTYNSILQRKDSSLAESSEHYWEQIHTGLEQFDHNQQLQAALKRITGKDLFEFFQHYISGSSTARKVVIMVYGKNKMPKETEIQHFENHIDIENIDRKNMKYL